MGKVEYLDATAYIIAAFSFAVWIISCITALLSFELGSLFPKIISYSIVIFATIFCVICLFLKRITYPWKISIMMILFFLLNRLFNYFLYRNIILNYMPKDAELRLDVYMLIFNIFFVLPIAFLGLFLFRYLAKSHIQETSLINKKLLSWIISILFWIPLLVAVIRLKDWKVFYVSDLIMGFLYPFMLSIIISLIISIFLISMRKKTDGTTSILIGKTIKLSFVTFFIILCSSLFISLIRSVFV